MEYTPLPAVNAQSAPKRPFKLPNVPVVKLAEVPLRAVPAAKVHKTHDKAPKTKPSYGMTKPYMACVHGVKAPYSEH